MLRLIKFKYFFYIIITIITFGLDLTRFMRYGCIPTSLNECRSVNIIWKIIIQVTTIKIKKFPTRAINNNQ